MHVFLSILACILAGSAFYLASRHQRLFQAERLTRRHRRFLRGCGVVLLMLAVACVSRRVEFSTSLFFVLSITMLAFAWVPWLPIVFAKLAGRERR